MKKKVNGIVFANEGYSLYGIHPVLFPFIQSACFIRSWFLLLIIAQCSTLIAQTRTTEMSAPVSAPSTSWTLVIHGGAGGTLKGTMPLQKEKEYTEQLELVLQSGAKILQKGGSSVDAVETCIRLMEDSPLFNAGKGAVLTEEGKIELDASIMDGKTLKAGAVAGVKTIKNPISAARAVMEKTKHVMLINGGAEKFAKESGLEIVDSSYFITGERMEQYEKMIREQDKSKTGKEEKHGTVGVVALDQDGNLAAGTSTGGMPGKMRGRVGDTPIIGAGTYADNNTCAVSCTGHGEFFITNVVAYDVAALMDYKGMTLEDAAKHEVMVKLKSQNADGGLIAVDKKGNITMPFNTNSMIRGYIKSDGSKEILIY